jgi:cytochrome P450
LLISHQEKYKKLQAELDQFDQPFTNANLSKLPYLNAVINESLRMMPPVPSGMMHRVTPPEGITIKDTFIPGNTAVGIGAYLVQRDPRCFGKPDEFIPERWLGEGPEPFNRNAIFTFSIGPYGCVGKQLAWLELRDLTAALVKNFNMKFTKDFDVEGFVETLQDNVTMTRAHIPVEVQVRQMI